MQLENRAIVELIKLGLGKSSSYTFPKGVYWSKVLETSLMHGVAAMAFDGIRRCYDEHEDMSLDVDTKLEWIGNQQMQEQDYLQQEKLIADLADFYHRHGIKMMVLKGYGLSLDYPKPSHRPCGDLDIYLFGEQERADKLLSVELGIETDNSRHHHSVFLYKGLSVENHYDFLNTYAHLSNRKIEKRLKELASDALRKKMRGGTEVMLPSPDFNALFLLRHMAAHFAGSAMNLRQVLDWGVFVEKHHEKVDWGNLIPFVKELNMHHFLGAVNYICYQYLGFTKSLFAFYEDEGYGERVFQDLFNPENMKPKEKGFVRFVYSRYQKWWQNRWKHRIVYSEGLFVTFLVQMFAHLMKPATLVNRK